MTVIPAGRPLDTADKVVIKKMRGLFRRVRFVTLDLGNMSFSLERLLRVRLCVRACVTLVSCLFTL